MITLDEPYQPRPIRFLGLWPFGSGWRMKAYGIRYSPGGAQDTPDPALLQAARHLAETRLSDVHSNHYGIGFIGIHQGKTGNFVFVDWWADENELHHHVYVSTSEHPTAFDYLTPTGLTACAWDLQVICFERHAWAEHILKQYPKAVLDTPA